MSSTPFPTLETFIAAIKPYALAIELRYGIPWLLIATHAAHESRNGNSLLAIEANNLFGVTGDSWMTQGKPVYLINTKEFNVAHEPYFTKRPFRKYSHWTQALQDWADLIIRRYPQAYTAAKLGHVAEFFEALQAGGYATDPKYAEQLKTRYIELEAVA